MELLKSYFPNLSARQLEQFRLLADLFPEKNLAVNMISRQDMENLEERHILHSLAIARYISFKPQTRILDVGTGGGFPGIPLAIFFPECMFLLVDSIGKKIKMVDQLVDELGLTNVKTQHARAETLNYPVDFVVSRAVAPILDLHRWTKKLIRKDSRNDLANGYLLLKGGDLTVEIDEFKSKTHLWVKVWQNPLSQWFREPFFETKKLVYFPAG